MSPITNNDDDFNIDRLFCGAYDFIYKYKSSRWGNNDFWFKHSLAQCKICKKKCWNSRYGCSQYIIEYKLYIVNIL